MSRRDDRPAYVNCSPEQWATAKVEYALLKVNAAWAMQARFRTSAVAAAMGSGVFIAPLLALEFQTFIESRNYTPRVQPLAAPREPGNPLAAHLWQGSLPIPTVPLSDPFAWVDEAMQPRRQGF